MFELSQSLVPPAIATARSCHSPGLWDSADTRAVPWPQTPAILASFYSEEIQGEFQVLPMPLQRVLHPTASPGMFQHNGDI